MEIQLNKLLRPFTQAKSFYRVTLFLCMRGWTLSKGRLNQNALLLYTN